MRTHALTLVVSRRVAWALYALLGTAEESPVTDRGVRTAFRQARRVIEQTIPRPVNTRWNRYYAVDGEYELQVATRELRAMLKSRDRELVAWLDELCDEAARRGIHMKKKKEE